MTKHIDGKLMEPVERLTIDVPESFVGVVIEKLGTRKAQMQKMHNHGYGRVRMEFRRAQPRPDRPAQRAAHRHSRHHRDELAVRRLHRVAGRDTTSSDRRPGRRSRRA